MVLPRYLQLSIFCSFVLLIVMYRCNGVCCQGHRLQEDFCFTETDCQEQIYCQQRILVYNESANSTFMNFSRDFVCAAKLCRSNVGPQNIFYYGFTTGKLSAQVTSLAMYNICMDLHYNEIIHFLISTADFSGELTLTDRSYKKEVCTCITR